MVCSIDADRVFGPAVKGCRSDFDFTLLFQESILGIIPSSVFIFLALLRIVTLSRRPVIARLGHLYYSKLCVASLSASLQLAIFIQICLAKDKRTRASVPAAALGAGAALALCILSPFEHRRSLHPSSLVSAYLFISILFEITRARTYFLMGATALAATFTTSCLAKLSLFALEGREKVHHLNDGSKIHAPEDLAGPVSLTLFLWLNRLFLIGYRKTFANADLGLIGRSLYSSSLFPRFEAISKEKTGYSGNDLAFRTLKSLGSHLLAPIVPRLAVTGFTFSQSFLVTAFLNYLDSDRETPVSHGYGLIGACVFVYIGIAVSNSWYWRQTYKSVSMVRGVLVIAIFEKVLRLREDGSIESQANTLMISDVQRIVTGLTYTHELWAGVLETALATYLLQRLMGVSSVAMLGLAIACGFCSYFVASKISVQQQIWLAAMEKRIDATKHLLDSLKAVKMRGAEDRVSKVVNELRKLEIRAARLFRGLITISVFLSYSTVTLSPLLVFAAYIGIYGGGENLDSATMFSSLVLIALLGAPLIHLFQALPSLGSAQGCFKRIQAFLNISEKPNTEANGRLPKRLQESDTQAIRLSYESDDTAISLQDASLGWSADNAILKGVNLQVKGGSFVSIMGRVGSGKSLLLKSLVGEAVKISGSVVVPTASIAYCSQEPWLENMSAEQTWTQYGTQDAKWLHEVHDACCLGDIAALPDYHAGKIGSRGVRLSGGQRQRLSLARAIALKKNVVLLDDVFSALDRTTRERISTRLLGSNGLLRRLGTTVMYSTHETKIANLADEVYEVTVDGGLVRVTREDTNTKVKDDHIQETLSEAESDTETKEKESSVPAESASGAHEDEDSDDSTERMVSDRQVYVRYARAMSFKNAAVFLAMIIGFAVCLKLPDLWVQWWSTALKEGDTRGDGYWLGMFAMLEVLPLLVLCLCVFHLMFLIVPASASSLHSDLLRTVVRAPFAFISRIDTGSLMNRFNQDLMFVDTFLPLDLFNTCAELFTATFQIILVAMVSKQTLSVLPALFIALYAIQRFYLRTSKQLRLMEISWKADLHTKFGETISGLSVIRANGWVDPMRTKFMETLDRSQEPFYLLYMAQRWLQLVLNLVVAGLAIVIAGISVALRDKVASGAVGVAFLNTTTLGETLTNFIISWTSLETSLGAIARVSMFERDTPREGGEQPTTDVPGDWPRSGQVVFTNVWATYSPDVEDPPWTLLGVSLEIQPGQRVAVCGRTGSGKSTLMLALIGMVHMPVGTICVDGIDISRLQMSRFRDRFQVVSQDSFFEPTVTFRKELDPDGRFSDQQIQEMLRECLAWDFVAASGGLGSKITDATISAGETQLLAIARLLLQNSATVGGGIILLDEATSSLDHETEAHIEAVMAARLRNTTVIAIMHRLEAAMAYDKIAVLDKGFLVDFGETADVKARCDLFESLRK